MRILLHICCGPCAIVPVKWLKAAGHEVVGLFTNPNIHPAAEYVRRRDTVKAFQDRLGIEVIYKDTDYDPVIWLRAVAFREANRCFHCYQIRLERTRGIAKTGGFEAFTSTLLYSKRQKHEVIAALGRDIAGGGRPEFLYQDFREGWREGIETSKAWGMYRQDWCGCLLSEVERRQGGIGGAKP
jgi:predicted adenine nucleotide alpha hydrolase (AANH) superfamily ATPase